MSFSKSWHCTRWIEADQEIPTFWKTHSCKLIPNWTQNRMITYTYYISKLVRSLWLLNLAVCNILHGPLKLAVFWLPNCCMIYHQIFSTYIANKSLKLSFNLNCVLKSANDFKTNSNWFVLLSTCFRNLKPFRVKGNCSQTLHIHNRDRINILLTSSSQSVP